MSHSLPNFAAAALAVLVFMSAAQAQDLDDSENLNPTPSVSRTLHLFGEYSVLLADFAGGQGYRAGFIRDGGWGISAFFGTLGVDTLQSEGDVSTGIFNLGLHRNIDKDGKLWLQFDYGISQSHRFVNGAPLNGEDLTNYGFGVSYRPISRVHVGAMYHTALDVLSLSAGFAL